MADVKDPGFWSTAAPYITAVVGVAAGLTLAWISHNAKISEFRQAWINDLRKDIADFVSLAEKWFRKWDEGNWLEVTGREEFARNDVFPLANDARVILRRIRLRLNPRNNRYKAQDDEFLASLDDLLNPGKVLPDKSGGQLAETGR
jgi:hypothetical protein